MYEAGSFQIRSKLAVASEPPSEDTVMKCASVLSVLSRGLAACRSGSRSNERASR